MTYTVSLHGGHTLSQEHNRRDVRYTAKDGHIDKTRTADNIRLADGWPSFRDIYEDIFGDAVKDYNSRQKRADRRIDDYYAKVQNDKERHVAYEIIVQIGNKDNQPPAEQAVDVLRAYFGGWVQRNPQLVVSSAYIHLDESTPHMHIVYIPVAHYDRGMEWRVGLDRAMTQTMGITTKSRKQTAQMAWQAREREVLRELCAERGLETEAIKHHASGEHLDTLTYKATQEARKADKAAQEAQQARKAAQEAQEAEMAAYQRTEARMGDLQRREAAVEQKETMVRERYEKCKAELEDLRQQAEKEQAEAVAVWEELENAEGPEKIQMARDAIKWRDLQQGIGESAENPDELSEAIDNIVRTGQQIRERGLLQEQQLQHDDLDLEL